jgi:hypothetical protein
VDASGMESFSFGNGYRLLSIIGVNIIFGTRYHHGEPLKCLKTKRHFYINAPALL